MSHDVRVVDHQTGKTKVLPKNHHFIGGTYALGGTDEAWLNVTYNYAPHYYELWGHGLGGLSGKTVADTRPLVKQAAEALGTERSENYWEPSRGNAGAAMADLLVLMDVCDDSDTIEID